MAFQEGAPVTELNLKPFYCSTKLLDSRRQLYPSSNFKSETDALEFYFVCFVKDIRNAFTDETFSKRGESFCYDEPPARSLFI